MQTFYVHTHTDGGQTTRIHDGLGMLLCTCAHTEEEEEEEESKREIGGEESMLFIVLFCVPLSTEQWHSVVCGWERHLCQCLHVDGMC